MNGLSVAADVVAALAAVGGLLFVGLQLADQARAAEVNAATNIFSELGRRWGEYVRAIGANTNEREVTFTFAEVINYYETLCFLINNKVISPRVSLLIVPNIAATLQRMANDANLRARVTKLVTSPSALGEIRAFVAKEQARIANLPAVNAMLAAPSP